MEPQRVNKKLRGNSAGDFNNIDEESDNVQAGRPVQTMHSHTWVVIF